MTRHPDASRLDAIDGLRGIAIALVVAYHCTLVYGVRFGAFDALARTGFLGVELFFALSGFCMLYPYARARFAGTAPPSWSTYASRRAMKIVPSYLLALGVFTVLAAPRYDDRGALVAALLAHVAFVHPFFPQHFQAISAPLWTIGIEVQFYVLFPLVCGLFVRRPLTGFSLLVVVAGGYRLLLDALRLDTTFFPTSQVLAFLDVFAAGMLAAYVVAWYRSGAARVPERAMTLTALVTAALALAGLTLLAQSSVLTNDADFFTWHARWRLSLAALLFVLVTTSSLAFPSWRRVLANPVLVFLALISYNLYLWHLEVLVHANDLHVALPLGVAAAIAVAAAVTYGVERPFLRAKRPSVALRRVLAWRMNRPEPQSLTIP